jgi:hypothetical protein
MPLAVTAQEFGSMDEQEQFDYLLRVPTYSAGDLLEAGIDPTTPHLFRFVDSADGAMRYLQFQFTLGDNGTPNGVKWIIPLVNAMNTDRYGIDRDIEDESHRRYLLSFWLIPNARLHGKSALEALDSGDYTHRHIQEAVLSFWTA